MTGTRFGLLCLGAALLGACSTVPEVDAEGAIEAPQAYYADLPPSGLNDDWWKGFGDPALDELVARGLDANLDIAAARDRLRAAEALLRAERSDRLPQVDGGADIGIELGEGNDTVTAGAGLFGVFDPDLSGRLSAEVRAAVADYAEAGYLRADQRRIAAAAIASQYVEYRRAGAQLALLEESTDLQEQTLRVVTLRFEAGLAANLDVRRAAADLSQTRARRGLIEISRSEAGNALAVLLAEAPGAFMVPESGAPDAIPFYARGPDVGVPADLLRRRTDVLAAEARLSSAAAQVGIERSDLRPALTIPGSILLGDGTVDGLFSTFLGTLGAALDLPLFDGGRRRAEVAAAEAELDARYAEYRQTFLLALGEAENALVAIDSYRQRDAALAEAIGESEAALEQSNALYREGLATLFDVLDAQRQLISSRESLIDNQASLATANIALQLAVGSGGYAAEDAVTVTDAG